MKANCILGTCALIICLLLGSLCACRTAEDKRPDGGEYDTYPGFDRPLAETDAQGNLILPDYIFD